MKTITIEIPDGCEVQIVKKEEKKEPVIRTYQDLINNDIMLDGYGGNYLHNIKHLKQYRVKYSTHDIAASEKVARSMLAMAMISQLMPYYGGEVTDEEWENDDVKHVIFILKSQVVCGITYNKKTFLAFHTAEQRDNFLKYNKQLVKDYLMID